MSKLSARAGTEESSASFLRRNGWGIGDLLVGDEGCGPTIIQITAIGQQNVLAKTVSHNGKKVPGGESSWVFWCREWKKYE